jgi:His/Glu/Gln/Arg/opine family amino acid ABC transporter permease subunit
MSRFDWNWAFTWEVLPVVVVAGKYTILATFLGFTIALVLGLVFALLRGVRVAPIRWLAGFLVEFIRGTPVLVQIYFLYFVLPRFGIVLPALTTGIAALGLHYATYVSEVYRGGIAGVERIQWEAATALNLGPRQTFFRIVLPQSHGRNQAQHEEDQPDQGDRLRDIPLHRADHPDRADLPRAEPDFGRGNSAGREGFKAALGRGAGPMIEPLSLASSR